MTGMAQKDDNTVPETEGGNSSPFTPWWFIAAGFVLLVIIGLVVALFLPRQTRETAPATTTESASAGDRAPSSAPVAGGTGEPPGDTCNVPVKDTSIPTEGPKAEWVPDGYVLVPTSKTYGPVANGSKWGCFAHSPAGALFAAANFIDGVSGGDYAAFAKEAAVDNTARDAWIAGEDPDLHTQTGGDVAQFSGFQFIGTDEDAVTVRISAQQGSTVGAWTVALVWDTSAQNWKADLGTSDLTVAEVTNPQAFTTWSMDDGGGDR